MAAAQDGRSLSRFAQVRPDLHILQEGSGQRVSQMTIPTTIHLIDHYLGQSETFIYQYLSKMRKTRPVVIAQYVINRPSFPLTDVVQLSQPNLMRWIRHRVLLKFGLDLFPLTAQTVHISRRYGGKVLHAHFGHVGYRVLALKRATGMPLVTTFYGFDMSLFPDEDPGSEPIAVCSTPAICSSLKGRT